MQKLSPERAAMVYVASGSVHPELARDVAEEMGVELGPVEYRQHANTEQYFRYPSNVRNHDVIIVQTHSAVEGHSVQDALWEQVLMASAARMSGARTIAAVCPYMGYTRSDKKDKGREIIGIQTTIDALVMAGVSQIMAYDLHSGTTQGLLRGPFDNMSMKQALRQEVELGLISADYDKESWLVVAPDEGALKTNKKQARLLGGAETVFIPKEHDKDDSTVLHREKLGFDPDGRVCVVFDDMFDTAGTIVSAAEALKGAGASAVHIAATHNIFSGKALEVLQTEAIDRIVTADTHPDRGASEALGTKYTVLKSGPLIGRALVANLTGASVSELYED